jgi:hypothetical protein
MKSDFFLALWLFYSTFSNAFLNALLTMDSPLSVRLTTGVGEE